MSMNSVDVFLVSTTVHSIQMDFVTDVVAGLVVFGLSRLFGFLYHKAKKLMKSR